MCFVISRSKHFLLMGVTDTGQESFMQAGFDFLGTEMMMVLLRHVGTAACLSELFKMSAKTSFSCSAQSQTPLTPHSARQQCQHARKVPPSSLCPRSQTQPA